MVKFGIFLVGFGSGILLGMVFGIMLIQRNHKHKEEGHGQGTTC